MDALTLPEWVFFGAVIVASYAIRGSTGFGGVTVPLLALVLSLKILAPMASFLGLVSSWVIVRHDARHIVWRDLWRILPWVAAGVGVGLYLFRLLDATLLARALGVFSIVFGLWSLWSAPGRSAGARPPVRLVVPVLGTVAGFVGTIFGTNAGSFFAIYLDLLRHDKTAFRATVAAILLALGIMRVGGYVAVGAFDRDVLIACAIALPLMLIGAMLGNHIHARLDPVRFRRLVALILLVSGLLLVLR